MKQEIDITYNGAELTVTGVYYHSFPGDAYTPPLESSFDIESVENGDGDITNTLSVSDIDEIERIVIEIIENE